MYCICNKKCIVVTGVCVCLVFLLGDAFLDYCTYLLTALAPQSVPLYIFIFFERLTFDLDLDLLHVSRS